MHRQSGRARQKLRRFLFIETKTEGEPLTVGQDILLRALSFVPGFTVVLIRGPNSCPEHVTIFRRGGFQSEPTSREDFQQRVDRWYDATNEGKPKHQVRTAKTRS